MIARIITTITNSTRLNARRRRLPARRALGEGMSWHAPAAPTRTTAAPPAQRAGRASPAAGWRPLAWAIRVDSSARRPRLRHGPKNPSPAGARARPLSVGPPSGPHTPHRPAPAARTAAGRPPRADGVSRLAPDRYETTSAGRFAASSLSNRMFDGLAADALITNVTTFRPAAFSDWRNGATFTSYHWPVVPKTGAAARSWVFATGLLFHVIPVSVHVVSAALYTWNPALSADVLSSRPNRRSLAELIVVTDEMSKRRYASRFQPAAPCLTCSTVAAPKLVSAYVLPSRTYASAAARSVTGSAGGGSTTPVGTKASQLMPPAAPSALFRSMASRRTWVPLVRKGLRAVRVTMSS